MLVLGFLFLVKGADMFVDGSSSLAKTLRIPAVIIGLTIVAMGTSAPEASVSINAALVGNNDIAVSNVIGSNIFNISLIIGASAAISPFEIQSISTVDMAMVIVAILMLWMAALTFKKRMLDRVEGAIFILVYIAYMVYLTMHG